MSTHRRPRVQREQTACPDDRQSLPPVLPEEDKPLLATNTGVRLSCTMAAMISLFAIFLCWAEKDSKVIRRYAVQSTALAACHLCGAIPLMLISLLMGSIPYLGFLMKLMGWLVYIAAAVVVLAMRIKLMERAWLGRQFDLPLLERIVQRFY